MHSWLPLFVTSAQLGSASVSDCSLFKLDAKVTRLDLLVASDRGPRGPGATDELRGAL